MKTIGYKRNWLGINVKDGWRYMVTSLTRTHKPCGYPIKIGKTDEGELFDYCDKCEVYYY